jgi:hypothetical protein
MWSKAIYTPDICMRDPLSSPSCPGYFTALSSTTSTSTITATPEPIVQTTTTTADSGSIATTNPTRIETTVQASQPIASTSSTSTTSSVASVSTTASPSPSREVSSSGLSIGLSVVARNQQREQALAIQTAQTAVAAAEQTAQQAAQDAISVAQTSSANSAVSSSGSVVRQIASNVRSEQTQATSISQAQTNTSVAMFQPPSTQARSNDTRSVASIAITEATSVSNNQQLNSFTTNTETVSSASVSSIYSLLPFTPLQQVQSQNGLIFNQEIREKTENFTFGSQSQTNTSGSELQILDSQRMLTDRSNPLYAVINERSIEVQSNQTMQQRSSVNTNAANNEVAGGVDLTRMAVIPSGYNQYLNLVIADAAFYAPKEVYKNQRNVDNVRALRQMSSDRLHQEMVNQQYRK